jgi:Undecaprenyl-phosphate glucose phosphotransferase
MSNSLNTNRSNTSSRPKVDAGLDVSGLQALAAGITQDVPGSPPSDGVARRGPFRPEVWLNARQRHASRLAGHYFRTIDVLVVLGVSLLCGWASGSGTLLQDRMAEVLPYAVGAVTVLGLLRSFRLYQFARGEPVLLHLSRVSGVVLASAGVALLLGLAIDPFGLDNGWIVIWSAATLMALYTLHLIWTSTVARWRANGALTPNVVIVGATKHAERLIRDALKRRDINVLGVFDDRLARSPTSIEGVPVLGGSNDLLTHRMTPYVDKIVLAIDPNAQARVRELTSRLQTLPNEVMLLVDPQRVSERSAALAKLARAPLASLDGPFDADQRAFNKRIQDILVGSLAFVVLTPVMVLCALAIRLDSPGPIFFKQRRHGFNQEEIVVWKFRSMRQETADATASRQVTVDDDRITRIGKFMRSTSLDELPQLLNVLKGEMSLVGPRPHAIGMKTGQIESAQLVAEYAHRHRMKPGMTGWAAINGSRGPLHNAQDVRRRVQLDIDYIERQSLWLDLRIIVATVPVLLGDKLAIR